MTAMARSWNRLCDREWYGIGTMLSIFDRPDGYWIADDGGWLKTSFEDCEIVAGPFGSLRAAKAAYLLLDGGRSWLR